MTLVQDFKKAVNEIAFQISRSRGFEIVRENGTACIQMLSRATRHIVEAPGKARREAIKGAKIALTDMQDFMNRSDIPAKMGLFARMAVSQAMAPQPELVPVPVKATHRKPRHNGS